MNFMDAVDLYTIFGNALDNALECVSNIKDQTKRIVSVAVWERNNILMIQMENYAENKVLLNQQGLPVTDKKDKKGGHGMQSILYAVQKYDGNLWIQNEDNIFILTISIPIPLPLINKNSTLIS